MYTYIYLTNSFAVYKTDYQLYYVGKLWLHHIYVNINIYIYMYISHPLFLRYAKQIINYVMLESYGYTAQEMMLEPAKVPLTISSQVEELPAFYVSVPTYEDDRLAVSTASYVTGDFSQVALAYVMRVRINMLVYESLSLCVSLILCLWRVHVCVCMCVCE